MLERTDAAVDNSERGAPRRGPLDPAAWFALLLLSAVWSWWAWKEGAFFETVLFPGAIVLCAGGALLLWFRPPPARRPPRVVIVAAVALTILGCWSMVSALWSPAANIAIEDGQRILVYALSFALGFKLCDLLRERRHLSVLPLTVAGGFAGMLTVIMLATGDDPRELLKGDGTLDFPLGYRNAEAAFFAIASFAALGLAADREGDWRLRAAGLASSTLCIELFLLAQSRASVPAMLAAIAVYVIAAPRRLHAVIWLALAVLPAVAILPGLADLYSAAGDGLKDVTDEMNHVGIVVMLTVAAALVLGVAGAILDRRGRPGEGEPVRSNRWVLAGLVTLALAATAVFVAEVGDPIDWIGERAEEFRTTGSPDLSDRSSRFTFNAGSERYDFWRVALSLDDFEHSPLFGDGGGSFTYRYTREREYGLYVDDAHSVELEVFAELGIVGLVLFGVAIVGATAGILKGRRTGASAAHLGAIALTVGTYWLVHTSVDWFWPYPAITAPVLALAGAACAPAVRSIGRGSTRWPTGLLTAALAALAITAIPPWLSQRYADGAYAAWRTDLELAYDNLDRAQRLSPMNDMPLLAEASIARAAGDRERALAALREAAEVRPEEWATHYLLAELQAKSDRTAAREEIRIALGQNPLEPRVRELAAELGIGVPPIEGDVG